MKCEICKNKIEVQMLDMYEAGAIEQPLCKDCYTTISRQTKEERIDWEKLTEDYLKYK